MASISIVSAVYNTGNMVPELVRRIEQSVLQITNNFEIILADEVSFLNKASIQLTLDHLPRNSHVIINGTRSAYIDYDVLEILHNFKENAHYKNIKVELKGIKEVYKVQAH